MRYIIFFIFLIASFFLYCILIPSTTFDQLLEDEEQMQFLAEYARRHQKRSE